MSITELDAWDTKMSKAEPLCAASWVISASQEAEYCRCTREGRRDQF